MRGKVLEGFALVTAIIFVITIWALLVQFIGVNDNNKATIMGGALSMIGGMVGAFSAYFIAKMQMTKQLDLQYKKEEEKMVKEVKISNFFKLLEIGDNLLQLINKLHVSLVEGLIESLVSQENIVNREKEIRVLVQEIKEQSTRVVLYKVFFDDRVLNNFPDLPQAIKDMEQMVYRMLIDHQQSALEFSAQEVLERVSELNHEINKEVVKVLTKPKEDTAKILSYTNLYLKKSIE